MSLKQVDVKTAHKLQSDEGHTYIDVRSIQEFEKGHPEGARNVPLLNLDPQTGHMQAQWRVPVGHAIALSTRDKATHRVSDGWPVGAGWSGACRVGISGCRERSWWLRWHAGPRNWPGRP